MKCAAVPRVHRKKIKCKLNVIKYIKQTKNMSEEVEGQYAFWFLEPLFNKSKKYSDYPMSEEKSRRQSCILIIARLIKLFYEILLVSSVCFPTSESGGGNNRREILKRLCLQLWSKEIK